MSFRLLRPLGALVAALPSVLVLACSGGSVDGPSDGAAGPGATVSTAFPGSGEPGDPAQPPSDGPSGTDPANPGGPTAGTGAPGTEVPGNGPGTELPGEPGTQPMGTCEGSVGASPLRRLGRLELQLTLKELFRLSAPPDVSSIPEDPKWKSFRSLAELQNVTTQHLRAYGDLAAALTSALLEDAPRRAEVLGCDTENPDCLADFTARFGRLAYRRALTNDELAELTTRAEELGGTTEEAVAFVIEALLSSPSFVFRVELGDGQEGSPSTLSGAELASKLSFAVLGRSPDAALLARGEAGELDSPEGFAEAARDLVSDPRAREFFAGFFEQWLGFEDMRPPPMPPRGFSDALLPQMVEETERLLADHAWGGADFLDVLSASYTYAAPELAEFHGLVPGSGSDAARIEIPSGHPRHGTGLLTHSSLIGAKGDGDLIAHRGKWLFSTFLCRDLELPVGLLDDLGTELEGLSRMEMLEKRRDDAACSTCHRVIDPIGVGFAQYDSAGRFDETVNLEDFPIVPELAGSEPPEFTSIAQLAEKLRARPEVPGCLAERVFLYTEGREPDTEDVCSIAKLTARFEGEGNSFEELLLALVTEPEFRLRRAATAGPTE